MLASRIKTELSSWSCSQAVSKPVWHIPSLFVQWKPPDDGQRNCPKHVELYSKNKSEKLVHLVGFIIRIYHDARSHERQKPVTKAKVIRTSDVVNLAPARQIPPHSHLLSTRPLHTPTRDTLRTQYTCVHPRRCLAAKNRWHERAHWTLSCGTA